MVSRRVLPLLLAPVVLAVGCNGGGDDLVVEATPAGVQSASQATLDAETATIEFSVTMDPSSMGLPGATEAIELSGDGQVDFVNQRSEMLFDFAALAGLLGDQGADLGGALDEPMRAIQDGTTSYVCFALFQMFAGAECMTADLSEQLGTEAGNGFFTGGGVDPQALLESLGGADAVEEVGEEEVVGVSTQHLRGTFTLAQALENLDADDAADVQAGFERLGISEEFADTPHTFDVWIDDENRIRQFRQELDLSAVTGAPAAPMVVEFRYVTFGEPVDIEIPTDAVDISELSGLFGGD